MQFHFDLDHQTGLLSSQELLESCSNCIRCVFAMSVLAVSQLTTHRNADTIGPGKLMLHGVIASSSFACVELARHKLFISLHI